MPEPGRLVEIAGVDVDIGGNAVVAGIDLTVDSGEIVTLIGPNGAGKTTVVRVVLGLQAPTRGRVWRRLGCRIGYVPQAIAVDPVLPLTVERFLSLGIRASTAAQRGVLDEVGVPQVWGRPVQRISGGEFRRVLLARALLRQPELLVLDEPVQGVDVNGQSDLYRLIGRLRDQRGCGILMVSHDLHLVMAATDRVLCINHHVCCVGRPEAVSRDPSYIAMFGPQVAGNLALYAHHHDHVHGPSGEVRPVAADAVAETERRHG